MFSLSSHMTLNALKETTQRSPLARVYNADLFLALDILLETPEARILQAKLDETEIGQVVAKLPVGTQPTEEQKKQLFEKEIFLLQQTPEGLAFRIKQAAYLNFALHQGH